MKNKAIFILIFVFLTCLASKCFANSAEPPSILIIVNNPPADLSLSLISGDTEKEARSSKTAWETQYTFYSQDMNTDDMLILKVSTGEETFECGIGHISSYRNIFTLNLQDESLTQGKHIFRSVILVSIRVVLTLILEGIIFLSFDFRNKKSWIAFLIINLVTQGVLNIWLDSFALMQSYLIFNLIFGELFVFISEVIAFSIFIKEHSILGRISYVFVANFISLIVGGYIIYALPV